MAEYKTQIARLELGSEEAAQRLDQALTKLASKSSRPNRVIDYTLRHLNIHTDSAGRNLIYPSLPMYEVDYTNAANVFSDTFRYLLEVPGRRRENNHQPVVIDPAGFHDAQSYRQSLRDGQTKIGEQTAIIYPNYEGGEPNPHDRPYVQTSAMKAGEVVIINKLNSRQVPEIQTIMLSVLERYHGTKPEGVSVQAFYHDVATVEDLGEILTAVYEKVGLCNNYGSLTESLPGFLSSVVAMDSANTEKTGLVKRDNGHFHGKAIYVPGDFFASDSPTERITGGGYLVRLEYEKGGARHYEFRPLSRDALIHDYRCHEFPDQSLEHLKLDYRQLTFPVGHPLHSKSDTKAYCEFFEDIAKINTLLREKDGPAQDDPSVADEPLSPPETRIRKPALADRLFEVNRGMRPAR